MFTAKDKSRQAVAVLPAGRYGRIESDRHRRWLSRSTVSAEDAPVEDLSRVLSVIGIEPPAEGLAALRFWGQTGDRPGAWIAAADPVHLEPRLDHLRVHALPPDQFAAGELRAIFDFLQASLAEDAGFAFARVGAHGYLRSVDAIATATVSASRLDGREPDEFMPGGEPAARYNRLVSEVQMSLHEHEVNVRREAGGLQPVNSVWFWGGGRAAEKTVRKVPPLFADDPLFRGYWESCTAAIHPWPGCFADCIAAAGDSFVAVTPDSGAGDSNSAYLDELRELWRARRLTRLTLLFRDGLTARCGRFDAFRIWRRAQELM